MSMSLHIRGNKKYKISDLPLAATFVSKHSGHKMVLEPAEEITRNDGTVSKVKDTGLEVWFKAGYARIQNKAVLEKILQHRSYCVAKFGFFPDTDDPTGFWQALGVVEVKQVPVKVTVPNAGIDLDLKKKITKATLEKLTSAKEAQEAPAEEEVTV